MNHPLLECMLKLPVRVLKIGGQCCYLIVMDVGYVRRKIQKNVLMSYLKSNVAERLYVHVFFLCFNVVLCMGLCVTLSIYSPCCYIA